MSYSIDANLLLYASNTTAPENRAALDFLSSRAGDPDLMCLTWPALMAYQRIATHPSIFEHPLDPATAWRNVRRLLSLPRARVIREDEGFAEDYERVAGDAGVRGNLVPDAHIATILRQHGVGTIYTADTDFRKFEFLEVVNPLR